jgi:hypothetical protein
MGGSLESPNIGWTSETPTSKQSPREWLVECMQLMAVGMKAELVLGAGLPAAVVSYHLGGCCFQGEVGGYRLRNATEPKIGSPRLVQCRGNGWGGGIRYGTGSTNTGVV